METPSQVEIEPEAIIPEDALGDEDENLPTPMWAKAIGMAFLAMVVFSAGYFWRVHEETRNSAVIHQLTSAERQKQIERFQNIAAMVADVNNIKPGMELAVYVTLVQKFVHPCPLSDEEIRLQCLKILDMTRSGLSLEVKR